MRSIFEVVERLPMSETEQVLPKNFDVISPRERHMLLRKLSPLRPEEAQVGWGMFVNLSDSEIAEEMGLKVEEVTDIRIDVQSFLATRPHIEGD